ncbi:rhomboid family intramembrane serine protease [Salirhabdus salicampi]|uniref:rhomboid family intramembrane serine protease n=1 Tax=Salirhabdus salicampi TaxID=476102 RepID=UPI0020C5434A|nr:rhomboid family intramembrane serine protease [Salirhabdus salicampi]MCP8616862.1 rhomboid family intramembrane serine protease [Salirhabdus salicampi]
MYINDQYYLWNLASKLIFEQHFEILQLDDQSNEIWLEKIKGNKTELVRLSLQGFDWANHVKKDIEGTIEQVRRNRKQIIGKEVMIYNVYVSQYPPVDDWSRLKRPHRLRDRKTYTIQTFYLESENREQELQRFLQNINVPPFSIQYHTEDEMANQLTVMKRAIHQESERKKQELASLFQYSTPFFTYIILAINVIVFYLVETSTEGGSTDTLNLIQWGAKFNPYIMEGEWWRIFSSMFLHIGFIHIMMNMLALFYLGTTVERMYGKTKFLIIYFLAGTVGGLASFAFNSSVAAGASGALFGLFGALLFFGVTNKKVFFQTMGKELLFIIGLNVILGLSVPNIDNGAHMGGLVGGFIASAIVQLPKRKSLLMQFGALFLYCGLVFGLIYSGIHQTFTGFDPNVSIVMGDRQVEENNYGKAVELYSEGIQHTGDHEQLQILYFKRAYVYIQQEELTKAKEDLLKAIEYNASFAEAHYNLALVYHKLDDIESAIHHVNTAVELNNDEQFRSLQERLLKVRDSLN